MAYKIKQCLANSKNYGGYRKTSDIKYIVIHYTANDGDTDESNGKYFQNNVVQASAHYFVDDDSVTISVPEQNVAWHCGAKSYKHATCRNANSIGIELCDTKANGSVYPTAATIANAIELAKSLMKTYNIPAANVIRHYDVTGKLCPAYWCGTTEKDKLWKTEFWNKLSSTSTTTSTKTTTTTTTTKATSTGTSYVVKVTASSGLNVRESPSTSAKVVTTVTKGSKYTIVEESNGWGLLKSYKSGRNGWVYLKYCEKV